MDIKSNEVKWISRSVPLSLFDIESKRKTPQGIRHHYIEVMTSFAEGATNIVVSSEQVEFFKNNNSCVSIMFVRFDENRKLIDMRELTPNQLYEEFELVPIKYRLRKRS
jgi:hypothetical protein